MEAAKFDRKTITINSDNGLNQFKCSGSPPNLMVFLNYPKLSKMKMKNSSDVNKEEVLANGFKMSNTLPATTSIILASLVKKLEELGIGRPSTYASIISNSNRGYADVINKRFFPTDRGKLLSAFLEKLFSKYVDYGFTAGLEDQLDDITLVKKNG